MKRSRSIILVLSGTIAGAVLSGCDPSPEAESPAEQVQVSADNSYTNNHYVPGVGYYHAPYRAWFPRPYNYYDPAYGYYHGDRWTPRPNPSLVQASKPSPEAVEEVGAGGSSGARTASSGFRSSGRSGSGTGSHSISRSGFGSSSHSASS